MYTACKPSVTTLTGWSVGALRLQQQSWHSGDISASLSLSLSSVTLATYFLHGNSISCCAHRRKKKEKKKKEGTLRDLNVSRTDLSSEIWTWRLEGIELRCSACLTVKLAVWWSNGGVRHNSHWQTFTLTEDEVGDVSMYESVQVCVCRIVHSPCVCVLHYYNLMFTPLAVCHRTYLDPTMCDCVFLDKQSTGKKKSLARSVIINIK